MASPPVDLDVLLMEGANLGSDKRCITETELEGEFVDLFRSTTGSSWRGLPRMSIARSRFTALA
jgi:hypothetical protein